MAIETHGDERLELPEVSTRPLLYIAVGFLVLLACAVGLLHAVYLHAVPNQTLPAPEMFPQPRVQTGQTEQLHLLEDAQTRRLNEYSWVDRKQGLVQIPIDRAMQLLAAEGAKAYDPLLPPQALDAPGAGAERLTTPSAQPSPGTTPASAAPATTPTPPNATGAAPNPSQGQTR
jgi:hypothetical protein